jgi:hypothetical protein
MMAVNGFFGAVQYFLGTLHFAFHQQTEHFFCRRGRFSDHGCGSMRAMGCTKASFTYTSPQFGELLGKTFIAFFFFLIKTQVLEQQYFAGLQCGGFAGGFLANTIVGELDVDATKQNPTNA